MKYVQTYGTKEAYIKDNTEPSTAHEELGEKGRAAVMDLFAKSAKNVSSLRNLAETFPPDDRVMLTATLDKRSEQLVRAEKHVRFNAYYNDRKI